MQKDSNPIQKNTLIWDCGSSLYDSFELDSFESQLDSAIASTRSLSMPHLSEPSLPTYSDAAKKRSKLSSALHRLLHMMLRLKPKRAKSFPPYISDHNIGGYGYGACTSLGGLSAIPEASEKGSPEISSVVRRTVSERFTSSNTVVQLKVVL
ncbi:uncharacterized protein [Typha angustifolia]|uniref:uncharacterized protein n=1 Tax=Typha angustifolia TaxID=59011 RepID=UPI003C2DB954